MNKHREILTSLGANDEIINELIEYTNNAFQFTELIPEQIDDEPFLELFRSMISESKNDDIAKILNSTMPHGDKDIIFTNSKDVKLEIYNSIAGNIPIFYAKNESDFQELVKKLIYKGKDIEIKKNVGASFASGKSIRFIILSNKPYSNIPANEINLLDEDWKDISIKIRRAHECTHYFTKRFLLSSRNNVHDELVADFAGFVSATGDYHPDWFLKGLGIDKFPAEQPEGRLSSYTSGLSPQAIETLKAITVKVAFNTKKWFDSPESQSLNFRDKILFLCKHNLLDLYSL